MSNIFPTEITEKEMQLGFKRVLMDSGYTSPIFGTPEIWPAFARPLTESDYLFKVEGGYKHMRYGYRESDKSRQCEWHPIGISLYAEPTISDGEVVVQKGSFAHVIGVKYVEH